MVRFLANLSRQMIAFLALAGGILFIVISDPPRTVCDSQIDVLKDEETPFLFKDRAKKSRKEATYRSIIDQCKATNSPGGCFELFMQLRHMVRSLSTVPIECDSKTASLGAVRKVIRESIELMVQLAWGEKVPDVYFEKYGWLDHSDMNLFCSLKDYYIRYWGKDTWEQFREKMMLALPGADKLSRQKLWDNTIFSSNCKQFQ